MHEPVGREDGALPGRPAEVEIDAFARALAGLDTPDALGVLLDRGSAAWLRREVFPAAARRLGDWWDSDEICFATVTLGMTYLQRLAWMHGRAVAPAGPLRPPMLLAALPGEQHTFGLNLLVEDLRARGVEPAVLPCPTREALVSAAASGRFTIIGLSAGTDDRLAEVAPLASRLRRAAPGRVRLLLGGPVVTSLAASAVGVDEIVGAPGGAMSAVDRLCALASHATFDHAAAA
jgi:methylmalonyl-CoA mutase cobalamin-binding subunit